MSRAYWQIIPQNVDLTCKLAPTQSSRDLRWVPNPGCVTSTAHQTADNLALNEARKTSDSLKNSWTPSKLMNTNQSTNLTDWFTDCMIPALDVQLNTHFTDWLADDLIDRLYIHLNRWFHTIWDLLPCICVRIRKAKLCCLHILH